MHASLHYGYTIHEQHYRSALMFKSSLKFNKSVKAYYIQVQMGTCTL